MQSSIGKSRSPTPARSKRSFARCHPLLGRTLLLPLLMLPSPVPVVEGLEAIHVQGAPTSYQSRSLSHCSLTGSDPNLTCCIMVGLIQMPTSLLTNWFNKSLQATWSSLVAGLMDTSTSINNASAISQCYRNLGNLQQPNTCSPDRSVDQIDQTLLSKQQ